MTAKIQTQLDAQAASSSPEQAGQRIKARTRENLNLRRRNRRRHLGVTARSGQTKTVRRKQSLRTSKTTSALNPNTRRPQPTTTNQSKTLCEKTHGTTMTSQTKTVGRKQLIWCLAIPSGACCHRNCSSRYRATTTACHRCVMPRRIRRAAMQPWDAAGTPTARPNSNCGTRRHTRRGRSRSHK